MKFSDVRQEGWEELRPYVDTCILPVTGLTGSEQPWEAVQALEELRDALDCFEIPYKGRVCTYPAYHFVQGDDTGARLQEVCGKLKGNGFRYIIIVSAKSELESMLAAAEADLYFAIPPERLHEQDPGIKQQIFVRLQQLWAKKADN